MRLLQTISPFKTKGIVILKYLVICIIVLVVLRTGLGNYRNDRSFVTLSLPVTIREITRVKETDRYRLQCDFLKKKFIFKIRKVIIHFF